MSERLIECIPNISEGRRQSIIDSIAACIPAADVALLDVHTDADHNRSVFTIAGTPEAVEDAVMRAAAVALSAIDLEQHTGAHPRIGAVDVIPFVPLRGISLMEMAERARAFSRRYHAAFGVPVYWYEASAQRQERTQLPIIRQGGFETLRQAIAVDAARAPDVGAAVLDGRGATVIGARAPLIAFNAWLDTDDVAVAQAIAREVRESGGGLPRLRAIGVLAGGRAQVSMNVIDFRRTSLYTIVRAVDAAARARGCMIVETELVGLVPQAALLAAAVEALHLPPDAAGAVLEKRMGDMLGDYREVVFE
jgi:glutamate formiminotransferase